MPRLCFDLMDVANVPQNDPETACPLPARRVFGTLAAGRLLCALF